MPKVLDFGLAKAFGPQWIAQGDARHERRAAGRHARLHGSRAGGRRHRLAGVGRLGARRDRLRDADAQPSVPPARDASAALTRPTPMAIDGPRRARAPAPVGAGCRVLPPRALLGTRAAAAGRAGVPAGAGAWACAMTLERWPLHHDAVDAGGRRCRRQLRSATPARRSAICARPTGRRSTRSCGAAATRPRTRRISRRDSSPACSNATTSAPRIPPAGGFALFSSRALQHYVINEHERDDHGEARRAAPASVARLRGGGAHVRARSAPRGFARSRVQPQVGGHQPRPRAAAPPR